MLQCLIKCYWYQVIICLIYSIILQTSAKKTGQHYYRVHLIVRKSCNNWIDLFTELSCDAWMRNDQVNQSLFLTYQVLLQMLSYLGKYYRWILKYRNISNQQLFISRIGTIVHDRLPNPNTIGVFVPISYRTCA